jgi:hypothetical protein
MIECTSFKSFQKGNFQGYANIYVEKWGIEITGCSLFMKDGRRWINLPSKEYVNKEGEKKFQPLFFFREKSHHEVFVNKVKEAIDKWCIENPETQQSQDTLFETASDDSDIPF